MITTREEKLLLVEIYERHWALVGSAAPRFSFEHAAWADALRYGPVVSFDQWFGCGTSGALYMRFYRSLRRLESRGLVILSRADGTRNFNVMLTMEGERLAVELGAKLP